MSTRKISLRHNLSPLQPYLLLKIAPNLFELELLLNDGDNGYQEKYCAQRASEWKTEAWLVTGQENVVFFNGKTGKQGKKVHPAQGELMTICGKVNINDPRYDIAFNFETTNLEFFPFDFGKRTFTNKFSNVHPGWHSVLIKIQSIVENYPGGICNFLFQMNSWFLLFYLREVGGGLFCFEGENYDSLNSLVAHLEGYARLQCKVSPVDFYCYDYGCSQFWVPNKGQAVGVEKRGLSCRIVYANDGLLQLSDIGGTAARLKEFTVPSTIRIQRV